MRKTVITLAVATVIALVAASLPLGSRFLPARLASAAQTVTVTGVAANNSSVKISFNAVSGAADYRVYDVANPMVVKYAGLTPGPNGQDVPATQIEWNMVEDGQPHTLVVQAVNELGPVPPASLYDGNNSPLAIPKPTPQMGMMSGLGMNEGPTADGNTSINGQGPYTNNPQVIAQSQPFVVQANPSLNAIPSLSGASQTFFDTFADSEASTLTQVARDDNAETARYTLNAGTPLSSTIQYQLADTKDSFPFIDAGHFMDVLFDGGTPGTNNPLHQGHGVMDFTPDKTASFANGQMLHLTEEVDGHMDSRRWMDILIAPASDPLTAFDADTGAYNSTNDAIRLQLFTGSNCTLDIYTGPAGGTQAPTGTAGGQYGSRLWGAAGQGANYCDMSQTVLNALDNRSRFDFFLTQNHAALFLNGQLVLQSAIPAGSFPWANQTMKVYYSHYLYHTDNDINELRQYSCDPMNAYWFNDPVNGTAASQDACGRAYPTGYGFPHSDERHWDNMGFEVLPSSAVPASGDFSGLASLIHMPQVVAPTFVSGGSAATPTNTPMPMGTPTNTPTATPTNTPSPANTPTATPTATPTSPPTNTPTSAPVTVTVNRASATPTTVTSGTATTLSTTVTSSGALSGAIIDFEVYNSAGSKVYQTSQSANLAANTAQTFTTSWAVPTTQAAGAYTLKVGVFGSGWSPMYAWDNNGATITVQAPVVVGNFENSTDGFSHTSLITSMAPSTYAPAVAMGSYALWTQYKIPAAGSQMQLYKTVNTTLTSYSTLSASVYAVQPTAAGMSVQVRFQVLGSNGLWYYSPYQTVASGIRTKVSWNMSSVPRAPLKSLYVDWKFSGSGTSSGNQLYLDAIQAS